MVETEYKILEIDPEKLAGIMADIGAQKIYDDVRTITYFDHVDHSQVKASEGIKLTEEGKLKLEHTQKDVSGQSNSVKVFVSRKAEVVEFLKRLGLQPITKVQARRISYEFDGVDLDIDCFPGIPPFMEIDLGDSKISLKDMLDRLGLEKRDAIIATTPEVFESYGKDYFAEFAISRGTLLT